jgi:hypothetical protein
MRRSLTDDEQEVIAKEIVEHLALSNWRSMVSHVCCRVDVNTPSHLEVSAIGANELKAELAGRITLFAKTAQLIPIH